FIILLFTMPLLLLLLTNPQDWFGIMLIPLTLLFIFNQGVFVRNFNTTVAILLVFFAKITISLINSNYITIYGAGADAKGFLRRAFFIVQNKLEINLLTTGSYLFENYLPFIFNITGISQFSGEMLSILVFVIATSYLLKIAENLYGPSYNTHLVYLFGLLPSMLIYTSIRSEEHTSELQSRFDLV